MTVQDTIDTITNVVNKYSSDSAIQKQVADDLHRIVPLLFDSIDVPNDWFQAGWRPAVGWVCAAAFFWSFVLQPMFILLFGMTHPANNLPLVDVHQLMPVLIGMLGLGGLRTYEKVRRWQQLPENTAATK